jgi:hypothetical protein
VPGDYEHTSERLPARAATDGVPAPFWVRGIEKRADGAELWAAFEWVDPVAVGYVRTKQYKYLSPAVNFAAKSRVTGKPIGARLTSVALTNHPFIDGLAPVTASERAPAPEAPARTFTPSPDALHAPGFGPRPNPHRPKDHVPMSTPKKPVAAPATEPAVLAPPPAPEAEMSLPMQPGAAPEAPAASPAPAPVDHAAMRAGFMRQCAEAMGMDHEAAEDQILGGIKAMVAKMEAIQQAEAQAQAARAAEMSARIVRAGLAPESAKEHLTTLCMSARPTFDALYPEDTIAAREKALADEAARTAAETAAKAKAGDLPPVVMSTRVNPDAATILMSHIGASAATTGDAAPAPNASAGASDPYVRVQTRIVEIRKGDPTVSLFDARTMAEREVFAQPSGAAVVHAPPAPEKSESAPPAGA